VPQVKSPALGHFAAGLLDLNFESSLGGPDIRAAFLFLSVFLWSDEKTATGTGALD